MSAHNLLHPLVMDDVNPPRLAQLAFDLDPPRARRRDPSTSHAAASSAVDLAKQHAVLVLGALMAGPGGCDQIASRAGLQPHAVGKRLAELERAGAIRLTGKTVPSNSGRAQREWCRA